MSNDCSERICQFGLAHVDTPKGDLDASGGQLTTPDFPVVPNDQMYPFGTTERYPAMQDSDGAILTNSAHYYRECSNKGICDRATGGCTCFDGYSGSACQRASCPSTSGGVCSGHGTCQTISNIAMLDNNNVYNLWDEDSTMGCVCDGNYEGPACDQKMCKVGTDPLYYDDFANIRYANYTVQFYTITDLVTTLDTDVIYGNYSLIFTDVYGEDWQTKPLDINANCARIIDALEGIPNNVIPANSVRCYKSEVPMHMLENSANNGQDPLNPLTEIISETTRMRIQEKYIVAFPGNPGLVPPLKVNKFLDGARPTLFTKEHGTTTMGWHIFPNGYTGEETDYVNDECQGVMVTLGSADITTVMGSHYLADISDTEAKLLKACLGDGNGISNDNVDIYNWDWGTFQNPHLIKLIDATQDTYTEYVRADGTTYKIEDVVINDKIRNVHWQDSTIVDFPVSKLCSKGASWVKNKGAKPNAPNDRFPVTFPTTSGLNNPSNLGTFAWCAARDPPGFFAVLYYDDCSAQGHTVRSGSVSSGLGVGGRTSLDIAHWGATTAPLAIGLTCSATNPWRLLTRSATDFSTTTKFHIYTTQGTLQQVSQASSAYTVDKNLADTNVPKMVQNFYSNVVHLTNATRSGTTNSNFGQVDCETNNPHVVSGSQSLDCLSKEDKIFFLNLGERQNDGGYSSTLKTFEDILYGTPTSGSGVANPGGGVTYYVPSAASFASNPVYINMYTVKKISREAKDFNMADQHSQVTSEGYRHQIVLDYGMNAKYESANNKGLAANAAVQTATIYKFYPPAGYNYVGPCSNRGICDSATGTCACFAGYTSDNCGVMNSLAH